MKPRVRTFLVWLFLVGLLGLLTCIGIGNSVYPRRGYDALVIDVNAGVIDRVEASGDDLIVHPHTGLTYKVEGIAEDEGIRDWLDQSGVPVTTRRETTSWLLPALLGVAVLVGVVYALRNRQQQANGGAGKTIFDMRRSNARQLKPGVEKTRFTDVGGHEEVKEALSDVVDFLKNPGRWTNAGVRLPRGVLLEGPPGGGKTLLARAVAGEAGAPFFVISASEFVEMFVGVGAARIRDLFETAKKAAPAVVFIDEIDAVGRRRGSGLGTAHDEREQTLNQLLVCLDGFEPSTRLVVIAATNRSDVLDRALLRPGRFDLRLTLGFPDVEARTQILKIHTRGKPLAQGVDLGLVAKRTPGVSGAVLEHLCNEAGMRAVRRSRKADKSSIPEAAALTLDDFFDALEAAARIERKFDALDALLVESTSQFTQPTGEVHARLVLADGSTVEGRIIWADASYVKLLPRAPTPLAATPAPPGGDATVAAAGETAPVVARLIPKSQLRAVEALAGTSIADAIRPDVWAKNRTETA